MNTYRALIRSNIEGHIIYDTVCCGNNEEDAFEDLSREYPEILTDYVWVELIRRGGN